MTMNKPQIRPKRPLLDRIVLDPTHSIDRARQIANPLAKLINDRKLFTVISDKKYVWVEGWTTMGAMLGVLPSIIDTKRLDDAPTWEAKAVIKSVDGREYTSADAMCSAKEKRWVGRDEYAIRSMAQTRAISKCYRLAFGWIMKLAGYEPTPAEEITEEMSQANNFKEKQYGGGEPKEYTPEEVLNLILTTVRDEPDNNRKIEILERALDNADFSDNQKKILQSIKKNLITTSQK